MCSVNEWDIYRIFCLDDIQNHSHNKCSFPFDSTWDSISCLHSCRYICAEIGFFLFQYTMSTVSFYSVSGSLIQFYQQQNNATRNSTNWATKKSQSIKAINCTNFSQLSTFYLVAPIHLRIHIWFLLLFQQMACHVDATVRTRNSFKILTIRWICKSDFPL